MPAPAPDPTTTEPEVAAELDGIPEFAPWDGRRVPVTLLGGYLGAGKTTVLNELLRITDRPIAVLVNDVGAINIDAALVKQRHGDTIELTDGCVCCSLTRGLADAFDELRARPEPPDHVVIELSGVADPHRVVPWAGSAGFVLDGVVVLADAERFEELADDAVVGPTIAAQVAAADLLVVTKADLAGDAAVRGTRDRLEHMAPHTAVADPGDPGGAAALLRLGGRRPGGAAAVPAPTLFDPHVTDVVPLPAPVAHEELAAILESLPPTTVRAKGVAVTPDGTSLLVQVVGRRRTVSPLPPAEAQPPTDLVVISVPGPTPVGPRHA